MNTNQARTSTTDLFVYRLEKPRADNFRVESPKKLLTQSLVSPKIDLVFKLIFGNNDRPKPLLDLVNAVLAALDEPGVKELTIQDSHLNPEHLDDKLAILDVKAKTDKGELINVEMQIINQRDWQNRSLYYWSRLFGEQLERGDSYANLKKTIAISLLDFQLLDRQRLYSLYQLKEKWDNHPFTNKLQLVFIELPKAAREKPTANTQIPTHLHHWIQFLNSENATQLNALPKNNPAIQEACDMLNKINQNPAERALAEARRKGQLDYNSNMMGARQEGIEEGLEQGLEKGLEQGLEKGLKRGREEGREKGVEEGVDKGLKIAAKAMKLQGIEMAQIINITGLNEIEIERL